MKGSFIHALIPSLKHLADATSQFLCGYDFLTPSSGSLENLGTKLRVRDLSSLALVTFSRDIDICFPRPCGNVDLCGCMCMYCCSLSPFLSFFAFLSPTPFSVSPCVCFVCINLALPSRIG